jgi:protease-4
MKEFMKNALSAALGVFIAFVAIWFLGLMFLVSILATTITAETSTKGIKESSILALRLNKPIVDRAANDPFEKLRGGEQLGLNDILQCIEHAQYDPKIKGIYLDATSVGGGYAAVEEIRNALTQFKEYGKFIISYGDYYTQKAYYLASVADKIYLHPEGEVEFKGVGSGVMFFKGLLDKVGVEAQIIRHGKFKSAVEPYMHDRMSQESREQINVYTGSIWQHILSGISKERNTSVKTLNNIASNLLLNNATAAIKYGLIDDVKYKDEVINELALLSLMTDEKEPRAVSINDYKKTINSGKNIQRNKDKIALVFAEGEIIDEGKAPGTIVGNQMAAELRKIRKDDNIKAVVFRVNSPGGSAMASDIIWREVDLLSKVKPVVVSMGDVAASGGYYIAASANQIMASPTTLTGSIGVFGILFNVQKGAREKLGVTVDIAKTNPSADVGNMFRPLTPMERNYIQKGIEQIYSTFTKHVADGRSLTVKRVDEIGQGRVWSGVDAQNLKLVDDYGGMYDAVRKAATLADLYDYQIEEYPKQKDSFALLMEAFSQTAVKIFSKTDVSILNSEVVKRMQRQHGKAQARMPFDIIMEE